jgi:hypothetical protein
MTPCEREQWRRQAVLYVANALQAEEKTAFEQGLAESQEVRDLLVEAMEQWAQRWPGSQPEASWRQKLRQRLRRDRMPTWGWRSLAAAALLGAAVGTLLAGGILWWRANPHHPTGWADAETQGVLLPEPAASAMLTSDGAADAIALTYVDLTNTDRVPVLRQWASERKPSHPSNVASVAHAPLLEYLSQPCPKPKHPGM